MNEILLSIVTVVKDDTEGLKRTIESLKEIKNDIQLIIVDGSRPELRPLVMSQANNICAKYLNDKGSGIYEAMNLGMSKATGKYLLFLNSGDRLHPFFDISGLLAQLKIGSRTIFGYVIETYKNSSYIRPKPGQEHRSFKTAPHQAIFYPSTFYSKNAYRLDIRVSADGEFTRRSLAAVGGVFLNLLVSEFFLGGVSNSYEKLKMVKIRVAENESKKNKTKIYLKYLLWKILPKQIFYQLLAFYKYKKFKKNKFFNDFDCKIIANYEN